MNDLDVLKRVQAIGEVKILKSRCFQSLNLKDLPGPAAVFDRSECSAEIRHGRVHDADESVLVDGTTLQPALVQTSVPIAWETWIRGEHA